MQREYLLGGVLVSVLVAALVTLAFTPQAVASHDEPVRQGSVGIEEIQIATNTVGGETIEVAADARLEHRRGVSRNVTVEFRVVDLDTALVATTQTVDVGTLRGDRETAVRTNLSMERSGDYQVEAIVYRDGERITVGQRQIRGTDALTPGYADSPVEFHRFAGQQLPPIEYTIQGSANNRSEIAVSAYLTNTGDVGSDDVELLVTARQTDSNVVADQRRVSVGSIEPGQSVTPETTLTVPENYNYYLDAVLWKDGVIIGTARSTAQLDPTEQVPENTTTRESDFEAGDFAGSDGSDDEPPDRETDTPAAGSGGAGFGVGAALLAVLASVLLIRRRNDD